MSSNCLRTLSSFVLVTFSLVHQFSIAHRNFSIAFSLLPEQELAKLLAKLLSSSISVLAFNSLSDSSCVATSCRCSHCWNATVLTCSPESKRSLPSPESMKRAMLLAWLRSCPYSSAQNSMRASLKNRVSPLDSPTRLDSSRTISSTDSGEEKTLFLTRFSMMCLSTLVDESISVKCLKSESKMSWVELGQLGKFSRSKFPRAAATLSSASFWTTIFPTVSAQKLKSFSSSFSFSLNLLAMSTRWLRHR
mmetsp:Transcript_10781/g.22370  ORF Transcript_10781/g.22370 Transcript_10781/m.22370 type:complete len:249 (+) Transcript_10781:1066-1812(+)